MDDKTIKFFSDGWKVTEAPTKAKEDERVLHFIASKEIVDRDFEIVKIDGLSVNNFKKNPVILLNHNASGLPIGKATSIWKKSNELHVKIQFASFEEYGLADTVYRLVRSGYLKALSIRFLPDYNKIEYVDPSKDRTGVRRIFHKSELLEISVATIPSNAVSLLQAKSKMIEDKILDEDEFNKFIELCDKKEDEEEKKQDEQNIEDISSEEFKETLDKQLEEIRKDIAIVIKALNDLQSKNQEEETNYFDNLFDPQDDGSNDPNQSNDESTDGKDMFQFLDEGTTEK